MELLRSMKAGKRRLIRNKCVCRKLCFRMFTVMELRRTGFLFFVSAGFIGYPTCLWCLSAVRERRNGFVLCRKGRTCFALCL